MRVPSLLAVACLVAGAGCQGSFSIEDEDGNPIDGVPTPACPVDPDCAIGGDCSVYECPDYWICETIAATGTKRCVNPGPDYPDGGSWECRVEGGVTICRGDHYPDGGGGGVWNCEMRAEFVECTDNRPHYPDGEGDGPWDCFYTRELLVCEEVPGDGSGWVCFDTETGTVCRRHNPDYPDDRDWDCYTMDGTVICTGRGDVPDGGGDWVCVDHGDTVVCEDDTPDYPPGGGDTPWDCRSRAEFWECEDGGDTPGGGDDVCVAGTYRWCDDAVYCSWGKQTCLPTGEWGACVEPDIGASGLVDRPDTACACRYFFFHSECCEDPATCIIPRDHRAPDCSGDGGLCSFCDPSREHADCGGDGDLCLVNRTSGATFCGESCTTAADCPSGYTCSAVRGAASQCTPTSGSCPGE